MFADVKQACNKCKGATTIFNPEEASMDFAPLFFQQKQKQQDKNKQYVYSIPIEALLKQQNYQPYQPNPFNQGAPFVRPNANAFIQQTPAFNPFIRQTPYTRQNPFMVMIYSN